MLLPKLPQRISEDTQFFFHDLKIFPLVLLNVCILNSQTNRIDNLLSWLLKKTTYTDTMDTKQGDLVPIAEQGDLVPIALKEEGLPPDFLSSDNWLRILLGKTNATMELRSKIEQFQERYTPSVQLPCTWY